MKKRFIFLIFIIFLFFLQCQEDDALMSPDITDIEREQSVNKEIRKVYEGKLDENGYALVSVPELTLSDMPLVLTYFKQEFNGDNPSDPTDPGPWWGILNNYYAEGKVHMSWGADEANMEYKIVLIKNTKVYEGKLDENGYALVSVPELTLSDMPLVFTYFKVEFNGDYQPPSFPTDPGPWWARFNNDYTEGKVHINWRADAANTEYKIVVVK